MHENTPSAGNPAEIDNFWLNTYLFTNPPPDYFSYDPPSFSENRKALLHTSKEGLFYEIHFFFSSALFPVLQEPIMTFHLWKILSGNILNMGIPQ